MTFSAGDLALIDATREVEIETRAADGTIHRTIIWAVVEDDAVWIRSYRGADARWYREALANPAVALHVAGRRFGARAVHAAEPAAIAACSAGLARGYAGDPDLPSMLLPETLACTLRLHPA